MPEDFIELGTYKEFIKRMEAEHKRLSDEDNRQNQRLNDLEKRQSNLEKLVSSVATLAAEQEHIKEDVSEIKEDVKMLTGKPGKRWESIVDKILWAILAAVIAFLLARIGLPV